MLKLTNIQKAIFKRRSVRGYLKKSVPKKIINNIFNIAQRAPSNANIQPWYVYVASGETKKRIEKQLISKVKKNIPTNSDYYYPKNFKFNMSYLRRQVECAKELYDNMGVARDDKIARTKAYLRNYEMYDAPHVCFIGMYEKFGPAVAIDVGGYIQTLMLAMNSYGVSSCAQATLRNYPNIIRKEFNIDKSIKILVGISFGYEDKTVLANKTRVGRDEIDENVFFKF
jgi:nitroreductase